MSAGYIEFEFDLPGALLSRLVEVFDQMEPAPLALSTLDKIPEKQGIYQLFLNNKLVYIGKTDAEAGLAKRLGRHRSKIQHRNGLEPSQVSFKAVRLFVFTAIDLETQLIHHYGGAELVSWNGSGFGSNDPGRERDTSTYKETHFDTKFPIDIDREIEFNVSAPHTAADVLRVLKSLLPYTFDFMRLNPDQENLIPI